MRARGMEEDSVYQKQDNQQTSLTQTRTTIQQFGPTSCRVSYFTLMASATERLFRLTNVEGSKELFHRHNEKWKNREQQPPQQSSTLARFIQNSQTARLCHYPLLNYHPQYYPDFVENR